MIPDPNGWSGPIVRRSKHAGARAGQKRKPRRKRRR